MFEADQEMLGDAQQRVKPRVTDPSLGVRIRTEQGSVSSVLSAPSPAIHRGKDMETMKALQEQEKEEERQAKAVRDKKSTNAAKRKAATPSIK